MTAQPGTDVSSDDKLWVALTYVFTPLIPIVLLLMEDKKNRPFIRAHNAQALAWGVVFQVFAAVFSTLTLAFGAICIYPLGFVVQLYWAYKAYQGNMVNIPFITNFVKKQGWA